VGYSGILFSARIAGADGGMEVFCGRSGGAGQQTSGEENRMKWHDSDAKVAAFFDLDGTLIGPPSLERRFFAGLRYRRAIAVQNYFRWLAQAAWLAPRGIQMMRHANKMYLRGVGVGDFRDEYAEGSQSKMTVAHFFAAGVDQVAWHARQGHAIVLMSGTLAPLARGMALALVLRLAARGIAAPIAVCATQLEEADERWTGRIVGQAMFGEAKGRAVRRVAEEAGFDLTRCYAYGDSECDQWMLEAVGRACVVNPSSRMERLARRRGWAVLKWHEQGETPRSVESQRSSEVVQGPERLA
jgi:HAD superfamily hydrolase (TIGR01490 family)